MLQQKKVCVSEVCQRAHTHLQTSHAACQLVQRRFQKTKITRVLLLCIEKMPTSDWWNTNLTLDDVWLVGENVRLVQVTFDNNFMFEGLSMLGQWQSMLCDSNEMSNQ